MKRLKDTAYLSVSAQVRAMENSLLTHERLEQALEARTVEDALKVVQECGYGELRSADSDAIDGAILSAREELERELHAALPDRRILDIFKLKHDYHNLKTLLKARFAGVDAGNICVDLGRVSPEELRQALENGEYDLLPGTLGSAAEEAKEILDTTRDGQLMDIFLDRCCYRELLDLAEPSPFLAGYVRRQIDSANLRALVRTLRMGKSPEFLAAALLEGGELAPEELLAVSREGGSGLTELYAPTDFAAAAESGAAALRGGPLTEFERLCETAVSAYLDMAQFIPFGEEAVIAYLAARETEFTNLRILLLGRSMDLPAEVIRARLRS